MVSCCAAKRTLNSNSMANKIRKSIGAGVKEIGCLASTLLKHHCHSDEGRITKNQSFRFFTPLHSVQNDNFRDSLIYLEIIVLFICRYLPDGVSGIVVNQQRTIVHNCYGYRSAVNLCFFPVGNKPGKEIFRLTGGLSVFKWYK